MTEQRIDNAETVAQTATVLLALTLRQFVTAIDELRVLESQVAWRTGRLAQRCDYPASRLGTARRLLVQHQVPEGQDSVTLLTALHGELRAVAQGIDRMLMQEEG